MTFSEKMIANRHEPLVTPRYEREDDGVPGAFYVVKDQCIICALPPEVAPENISWDDNFQSSGCDGCPNHCRVSKQPETNEELDLMIEAAWGSCVEAIRYCGSDEQTLGPFREKGLERLCDAIPESEITTDAPIDSLSRPWWKFWCPNERQPTENKGRQATASPSPAT